MPSHAQTEWTRLSPIKGRALAAMPKYYKKCRRLHTLDSSDPACTPTLKPELVHDRFWPQLPVVFKP